MEGDLDCDRRRGQGDRVSCAGDCAIDPTAEPAAVGDVRQCVAGGRRIAPCREETGELHREGERSATAGSAAEHAEKRERHRQRNRHLQRFLWCRNDSRRMGVAQISVMSPAVLGELCQRRLVVGKRSCLC